MRILLLFSLALATITCFAQESIEKLVNYNANFMVILISPLETELCSPTMVETIPQAGSLSVFPNPFSDFFQLKNPQAENAQLKIFDVQGNLLLTLEVNASETISLGESLSPGIYLLQLKTAEGFFSSRIVKEVP